MTNVISESLGVAIGLWFLFSGRTRLRLTLKNFRFDPGIIWRIVKIGIPATVMSIEMSVSQIILIWFIVPFGTLAVAAHTINQRVEMILFMPAMAFGMASGVMAGQNLGAGQPERAEKSAWLAAGLVEGFMVVSAVAILLWAENLVHIFSSEAELVALASVFLKIELVGCSVLGFYVAFSQCLTGVGDTLPPMIVSLTTSWMVRMPLAYFLPRVANLGVYGVRWAMVAGMLVGTVVFSIYFKLGRWKLKKV